MDKTPFLFLAAFFLFFTAGLSGLFNLNNHYVLDYKLNSSQLVGNNLRAALTSKSSFLREKGSYEIKKRGELVLNVNATGKYRLHLIGRASGGRPTEFSLRLGGKIVDRATLTLFEQYTSPILELTGEERITLAGNIDINHLELISASQHQNKFVFAKNWYPKENFYNPSDVGYDFIWMSQNASLYYYNPQPQQRVRLRLVLRSFHRPTCLVLTINHSEKQVVTIDNILSQERKPYVTEPLLLKRGDNVINLHVKEGCLVASEVEESNDHRCLSLALSRLDLKPY